MTEPAAAIDWPQMLETHKPWLSKVLHCRVGDSHAVEDLFQEIALAVIRQRGTETVPQEPEKVAPWLYRLAVRQTVDFHRKTNRKTHAKPIDLTAPGPPGEAVGVVASPVESLVAAESRQCFRLALGKLSASDQEILILKYTENWTYQQLSDHLGIPVRSVEYRLLLARKELRSLLKDQVAD